MLKLTMLVKRLPQLTHDEFDNHWRDRHAALVRAHREVLRIRRYVQTSPIADTAIQQAMRAGRGMLEADFDGCAELWWDNFDDHVAARSTPDGLAALRVLMEDERRFVDLARSIGWYGTEREVVANVA